MNKLILVNGDIATGKSHFAVLIRDRFDLPLFTKDEFKETLAETHPYSTYEESHQLSILAMDSLLDVFEQFAVDGKDLILEANFHEDVLKEIEDIANQYNYQTLHLNLYGSPEVLYERYVKRRDSGNRHPVHAVNKLNDFESFKEYVLSRKKEHLFGEVININTDNFNYQKDENIFELIKKFLNK